MRLTKHDLGNDVNGFLQGVTESSKVVEMAQRRPTQADVARAAGVSVATVSYVASGRRDRKNPATPEIVERVRAAMRELDYTPARAGRVLARNRTGLIAVVAGGMSNPWTYRVIGELEQVAADHDLSVVILRHQPTAGSSERIEGHLLEGLADAAVVIGGSVLDPRLLHRIGRRIPLLAMSDNIRPRGFDVMVQHEEAASRLAGEHLLRLGVRRPAFLLHGHTPGERQPRLEGFVSAFVDHGYDRDSILIAEDDDRVFAGFLDARHVATGLLEQPKRRRPDAIMTHSDRAAISVVWAATQLGISIPDELRVIGAGNIPEGAALSPALTTVGSEIDAFRPLFERLISRIDRPELRTRTLSVPWELIIRESA